MDEFKKFLPTGPDFAPFSSFASAVNTFLALILAGIVIVSAVLFGINMLRSALATRGSRMNDAAMHRAAAFANLANMVWPFAITLIVGVVFNIVNAIF